MMKIINWKPRVILLKADKMKKLLIIISTLFLFENLFFCYLLNIGKWFSNDNKLDWNEGRAFNPEIWLQNPTGNAKDEKCIRGKMLGELTNYVLYTRMSKNEIILALGGDGITYEIGECLSKRDKIVFTYDDNNNLKTTNYKIISEQK